MKLFDFFVLFARCDAMQATSSQKRFKTHCINYMVYYKIVGPLYLEDLCPVGQTEVKPSKLVPQISFHTSLARSLELSYL